MSPEKWALIREQNDPLHLLLWLFFTYLIYYLLQWSGVTGAIEWSVHEGAVALSGLATAKRTTSGAEPVLRADLVATSDGCKVVDFRAVPAISVASGRPDPMERRTIDVGKVMSLCVDGGCLPLMRDTASYTVRVDHAAFERAYCCRERVTFHLYWHGHMDSRTTMIIRSYLYTQDLNCTNMIVWTMNVKSFLCHYRADDSCSAYDTWGSKYRANVEYKLLDLPSELKVLQKFVDKDINISYVMRGAENGLDLSGIMRFALLANYGGGYIEADVLLLRDFNSLWEHEFAYGWEALNNCNTAVLRMKKGSTVARSMIRDAIDNEYKFHPRHVCPYAMRTNLSLHILPYRLFDAAWSLDVKRSTKDPCLCFHNVSEAFTVPCHKSALDGAFAYHWHNQHTTPILRNSFIGSWMEFLEEALP